MFKRPAPESISSEDESSGPKRPRRDNDVRNTSRPRLIKKQSASNAAAAASLSDDRNEGQGLEPDVLAYQELEASQRIQQQSMAPDDFDYLPDEDFHDEKTFRESWSPVTLLEQSKVLPKEPSEEYLPLDHNEASGTVCDSVSSWTSSLCRQTGTEAIMSFTKQGLSASIQTIGNLQLSREGRTQPSLQLKVVTVVTWLAVCFRFHVKNVDKSKRASLACKTLLQAALCVVKGMSGQEKERGTYGETRYPALERDALLEGLVQYWETRLIDSPRDMFRTWLSALPLDIELFSGILRNRTTASLLQTFKNEGITALAEKIIVMERESSKTALRDQLTHMPKWIRLTLVGILATINPPTLESIIRGDVLNRNLRKDDPVNVDLLAIQGRGDRAPAIYANIFADAAGVPPLAIHWLQWASDCEEYIKQRAAGDRMEEWAEAIDTVWYPLPYKHVVSDRRYCDTWKRTDNDSSRVEQKPSLKRREKIWDFKNKVLQRAQAACSDGRGLQPLQGPLCNIGYSKTPMQRLKTHERHTGSNYIMNLTEALFMNRYNNNFRIHQLLLFTCWDAAQPWLGEIALSQLMQCYVFDGTGFSHCQAGCSNNSMFRSGSSEDELWARRQCDVLGRLDRALKAELEIRDQARIEAANKQDPNLVVLGKFIDSLDLGL